MRLRIVVCFYYYCYYLVFFVSKSTTTLSPPSVVAVVAILYYNFLENYKKKKRKETDPSTHCTVRISYYNESTILFNFSVSHSRPRQSDGLARHSRTVSFTFGLIRSHIDSLKDEFRFRRTRPINFIVLADFFVFLCCSSRGCQYFHLSDGPSRF